MPISAPVSARITGWTVGTSGTTSVATKTLNTNSYTMDQLAQLFVILVQELQAT